MGEFCLKIQFSAEVAATIAQESSFFRGKGRKKTRMLKRGVILAFYSRFLVK